MELFANFIKYACTPQATKTSIASKNHKVPFSPNSSVFMSPLYSNNGKESKAKEIPMTPNKPVRSLKNSKESTIVIRGERDIIGKIK